MTGEDGGGPLQDPQTLLRGRRRATGSLARSGHRSERSELPAMNVPRTAVTMPVERRPAEAAPGLLAAPDLLVGVEIR